MNQYIFLVFFLCSALFSPNVAAVSLDIGLSAGTQVFNIDNTSGIDLGSFSDDLAYYPYLSARLQQNKLGWENWGYFFEFDLGKYDLNKQDIGDITVDMGTHVKGNYAYLTYVLMYTHNFAADSSMSYGLGAGLGYLSASGSAVLTEVPTDPTISIDVSDVYISVGLYFEYVKNDWVLKITGYGPRISDDQYDYQLSNVKLIFARRFYW